jgi:SAM-dependent methyltransferase
MLDEDIMEEWRLLAVKKWPGSVCEIDRKGMPRWYYEKDIPEEKLVEILNDEDYWIGVTSNFPSPEDMEKVVDLVYGEVVQKILDLKPESVLEVGCGLGYVVKSLREAGIKHSWGIDVSKWAVEHAVTDGVSQGSLLSLPAVPFQWDLVFSLDLLEHIPVADLDKAISELQRVGKRNFHLISCGSLADDRDATHVTMHKIGWWKERFPPDFIMEDKG